MKDGFAVIGVLVSVPALLAVSTLLNGWALHLLWSWFVTPIFGLPLLTIGQAIGLSMIVSFLTYQYVDCESKKESFAEKLATTIGFSVIRPLFTVFFGYVVHSLI